MSDRQAIRFPLFPIPLWPGKLRFGQRVPLADLNPDHITDLPGTTYSDWPLRLPEKARYDDYTFHTILGDPAGTNDAFIIVWSPPIWTAAELAALSTADRARGRSIKEYYTSRQHSFPPVLKDLQVEESISEGTVVSRRNYQEDVTASCPIKVTRYVTDVAPDIDRVTITEPIPGEIHGSRNGREIHFPSCLHPKVEFESSAPTDATLIDCTPDRIGEEPGDLRIFHPTNYTELQPHVFMIEVDEQEDLYFITEYEVTPPDGIPQIES